MTIATQRRHGGQMKTTTQSRFLEELPEEHLDWPSKVKKQQTQKTHKRLLMITWQV